MVVTCLKRSALRSSIPRHGAALEDLRLRQSRFRSLPGAFAACRSHLPLELPALRHPSCLDST